MPKISILSDEFTENERTDFLTLLKDEIQKIPTHFADPNMFFEKEHDVWCNIQNYEVNILVMRTTGFSVRTRLPQAECRVDVYTHRNGGVDYDYPVFVALIDEPLLNDVAFNKSDFNSQNTEILDRQIH